MYDYQVTRQHGIMCKIGIKIREGEGFYERRYSVQILGWTIV